MLDRYAVIMAGGTGSRLWPVSREKRPKQFIGVDDGKCMLIKTIERISSIVPPEKCLIVTINDLVDVTRKTVESMIPSENIITEPSRKNTAACIACATFTIRKKYGSGVLGFIPADSYVKDGAGYRRALKLAFETSEDTGELVIIGIKPAYPATGYGYIHFEGERGDPVGKVDRFVEKPAEDAAKKMVDAGTFLWNSGILMGNADTIINNVRQFLPEHYARLSDAIKSDGEKEAGARLKKEYDKLANISFDNGVLEKSGGIRVVKGDFDWDDMGTLNSLAKTFPSDENGNFIKGGHIGIDTANSVIYSENIPVATIGVEDMIVAVVDDTALICPRNRAQDIKKLVEKLRNNGYSYLT